MRRFLVVAMLVLTTVGAPTPTPAQDAAQPDQEADLERYLRLLGEGDATERVNASKWVRSHSEGFEERVMPLLEANLKHSDPEVRKWTVLALATRGDAALSMLERVVGSEQDPGVLNQMNATIRHLTEAKAHQEWVARHPCRNIDREELLTWEVRELCDPTGSYPPVILDLGDGTSLYGSRNRMNDQCFRGTPKKCRRKCMPVGTSVSTPSGPVAIETIAVGDVVWTVDLAGNRLAASVAAIKAVNASDHEVVVVSLGDGRVVRASALHPTATGVLFDDLRPGDAMDGSNIVNIAREPYHGAKTYDIRPEGETGVYFAEGVSVGTTIPAGARTAGR